MGHNDRYESATKSTRNQEGRLELHRNCRLLIEYRELDVRRHACVGDGMGPVHRRSWG